MEIIKYKKRRNRFYNAAHYHVKRNLFLSVPQAAFFNLQNFEVEREITHERLIHNQVKWIDKWFKPSSSCILNIYFVRDIPEAITVKQLSILKTSQKCMLCKIHVVSN